MLCLKLNTRIKIKLRPMYKVASLAFGKHTTYSDHLKNCYYTMKNYSLPRSTANYFQYLA